MADALAGLGPLTRLGLRRDRVLLPVWVGGFAAVAVASTAATADLYPDVASRVQAAEAVNASAALVALYGRVYDPTSLGELSLFKLTVLGSSIVAVLAVFVVVRHSRADEESGRLELLSGGRLGRLAPLAAALVLAVGASIAIGALTAAGLAAVGLPVAGSIAFGLGWTAIGLVFAGVAAVAAQVTASARAARGLALAVIAAAYALRAVGDLAESGSAWLSWLSPIGWTAQVRAFAGDRWWVLLPSLLLAVGLALGAAALRARRDLGAGLLPGRPGPAHGRLRSTGALAVRLHARPVVAWVVAFAVGGALLGAIISSVPDFLSTPAAREVIARLGGGEGLIDTFIGASLGIIGAVAAAFGISTASWLRSEEADGRAEWLLSAPVTRVRWALGHCLVAITGVALLLLVSGVTMGVTAALTLDDGTLVPRVLAASLAQIPAAWVLTCIVVLLAGWMPRASAAAWVVLIACVAIGEFGALWGVPQAVMDVSPLQHTPRLPVDGAWALPLTVLVGVAVAALLAGLAGLRRRDIPA